MQQSDIQNTYYSHENENCTVPLYDSTSTEQPNVSGEASSGQSLLDHKYLMLFNQLTKLSLTTPWESMTKKSSFPVFITEHFRRKMETC